MLKRTTEEVREYFRQQGCELLDDYRGAQIKMRYRCSCGQHSEINWNHFSNGRRCGHCAKWGLKHKRSLDQVQAIFAARGCEFLDAEFKGIHHKHSYRCKCGRESSITFGAFHFQEQYCRECGLKKLQKENHPAWQKDRVKLREKQLFRKKCYKALSATLKAVDKEKVGHTTDMLGYGPKELQEYIMQHPNWPKVKNKRWHLDHIFPINAFLEHNIKDVRLINALDNLQPLLGKENVSKHAKYDVVAFKKWLKSK